MKHILKLIFGLSYILGTMPLVAQVINLEQLYVSENTTVSIHENFTNANDATLSNNGDIFTHANWVNLGNIDFNTDLQNSASGTIYFVGSQTQTIAGSESSYYNNIVFNNTASQPAFLASGFLSVATQSNFENGIVDTDSFSGIFAFENNATHINTSNTSHVDGYVVKTGDTPFTYPIGDAAFYRALSITAPNTATDTFESKYFFEATTTNYPVSNLAGNLVLIDTDEYWEVSRVTGDAAVFITLSWDTATTPEDILETPLENITVARWDASSNAWVNEGGVVNASEQTVTTTTAIDTYGIFTLARTNGSVLPCGIEVANTLITPNGDMLNDAFSITVAAQSTCVNNINVKIFNRWGVKVFEGNDYGTGGPLFNGVSDGRATIRTNDGIPTSTYFYVLTIDYNTVNGNSETVKQTDYLYVNGD